MAIAFPFNEKLLQTAASWLKEMVSGFINANPIVYEKTERRARTAPGDVAEYAVEPINQQEVFDNLFSLITFDCISCPLNLPSFIYLTTIHSFIIKLELKFTCL